MSCTLILPYALYCVLYNCKIFFSIRRRYFKIWHESVSINKITPNSFLTLIESTCSRRMNRGSGQSRDQDLIGDVVGQRSIRILKGIPQLPINDELLPLLYLLPFPSY